MSRIEDLNRVVGHVAREIGVRVVDQESYAVLRSADRDEYNFVPVGSEEQLARAKAENELAWRLLNVTAISGPREPGCGAARAAGRGGSAVRGRRSRVWASEHRSTEHGETCSVLSLRID